jgi:hypothetical protein
MLRQLVMIVSTGLFLLTCALAIASCIWSEPRGIGQATEIIDPNGAIVGTEFRGVAFDKAAIVIGVRSQERGYEDSRGMPTMVPTPRTRVTRWTTDAQDLGHATSSDQIRRPSSKKPSTRRACHSGCLH